MAATEMFRFKHLIHGRSLMQECLRSFEKEIRFTLEAIPCICSSLEDHRWMERCKGVAMLDTER